MSLVPHEGLRQSAIVAVRGKQGPVWHVLGDARRYGDRRDVRVHDRDSLDQVRSLEGLLSRFGVGEIVYDPTGGFERALRLVSAARNARGRLGRRLRSIHLLADGRALHARVQDAADIQYVAAVLGETFARGLSGSGLELAMTVSLKPAPAGALAVERLVARQEDIARMGARASAAVAVLGAAFAGLHGAAARAGTNPQPLAPAGREVEALAVKPQDIAAARPEFILAGGLEPGPRPRPPRRPERRGPRVEAPPPAPEPTLACPTGDPSPTMTARLRAIYDRNSALTALHLDDRDPGLASEAFNQKAFELVRRTPVSTFATPDLIPEVDGVKVLAASRLRSTGRRSGETHFVLTIGQCAPPAPIAPPAPPPTPPEPPVIAPPPPPAPKSRSYFDLGADYINRDVQDGGVVVGHGQIDLGRDWALNLQGAAGRIDSEFAGGLQAGVQQFSKLAREDQAALGAFASAVTSVGPNGDDFDIYRAGLGAAFIGANVQLVIRGGYAQSEGYVERDGGFVRGEATWFVTPDLALDLAVEDDPITGAGAGVGFAARPFSEVFPQLMVDADANWHADGEDSFRVGLRWLFGAEESRTVRERRARQGMAPTLQVELERLPDRDDASAGSIPYCGEGECPAT